MSEHLLGVHDLSETAYHKASGVSKSSLDRIAPPYTPAHYRAYMDEPSEEPTEAQKFGSLLHAALLTPDKLDVAVKPEGLDMRTKTGKEWAESNSGKNIINSDQKTMIDRCIENVWKHPFASRLMKSSDLERSLFAEDSHGTHRKGRLDILPRGGNIVADLKTCQSAAPDEFEKSIYNYRYGVQSAYYLDLCELCGMEREKFVFICVEKSPPYLVAVYELDPDVVEFGRKLYQRDLTILRHCRETNTWPGYPVDVTRVGVPMFARKAMEAIL